MGDRSQRVKLLQSLEKARDSRVVTYFTGDRPPFAARIAEDAVLPLYRHLLALRSSDQNLRRLDLLLYTRGGDVGVPWRIITMMREFCSDLSILLTYKAHSAGTMIALGADQIVMGTKAELGPIDPTLVRAASGDTPVPPAEISVEDVSSYISFMRERAGITDQSALAQVIVRLADNLAPLTLGTVNRQYSHIRLVARKLLASRNEKTDEGRAATIIEALTEKMYSHGHAIGRREAAELGLPVIEPDRDLEAFMWGLYEQYEQMLQLNDGLDAEVLLAQAGTEELVMPDVPIAVIESLPRLDVFETNVTFRRKRQVPPSPQVNINLNLALPPNIDVRALPQNLQPILDLLVQQALKALPSLVQQEIVRQSPVVGVEGRTYGGKWKAKTQEEEKPC